MTDMNCVWKLYQVKMVKKKFQTESPTTVFQLEGLSPIYMNLHRNVKCPTTVTRRILYSYHIGRLY